MNRTVFHFALFLVFSGAIGCLAQSVNSPVSFQPSPDLQKRCLSPSPGPGATKQGKQATIGQGKAMIDTGDPKNSFWEETLDISGAGNVVSADMLWDASSKILYTFAHTELRCMHGKSMQGGVLIGIYAKKNFLGKTVGSGWWVVDLAQNECQAPIAGLYGCKFDAQGKTLACGHAELDIRVNDMAIVESTRF